MFVRGSTRAVTNIGLFCEIDTGLGELIMLSRDQKQKIVIDLIERFKRQKLAIFADIRGISVAKLSQFRRELKKADAELKVAKKTLFDRALNALGLGLKSRELDGEIGVIFCYDDEIIPAKTAAKFAKENETFKFLKGVMAGRILEASSVLVMAKLPSRERLLAQLAGVLNSPIQNLFNVLQGNIRNLVVVLGQIQSKRGS